MNIALLTDTWHPYTNGVITHIEVLGEGLRNLGHQVLILASDPHTKHHFIDQEGVLHCPGFTLKRIYGYGIAFPFSSERLKILKAFHPDVIHIHNEFGMGTFGMVAARKLKLPMVYTLHTAYDDYLHYLAPKPFMPITKALSHGYVRFLANYARITTGPSEKAAAYLKGRKVTSPFYYIPNSVDLQMFDANNIEPGIRQKIRHKYNIPDRQLTAIFVGRLGKEKSVETLLDLWKSSIQPNAPFMLMIVGDGPERDHLEQIATDAGIAHQIIFTGKIPYENMPQYYAAADVFVSASLTEMMSIALLEAQAMGLPVLQRLDQQSINQVIDQVNGFVYTNAADFGTHLKTFGQLSSLEWHDWQTRCRNHVAHQGAEDLANRLLELYRQACIAE